MTEADILASTYDDEVTVYRPIKKKLASGESIFQSGEKGLKIYEGIPCALSSHSGGKLLQSASTASAETEYSLFTRPEAEVQVNDFLLILHRGLEYRMIAGNPSRMLSHNEIPLREEKDHV